MVAVVPGADSLDAPNQARVALRLGRRGQSVIVPMPLISRHGCQDCHEGSTGLRYSGFARKLIADRRGLSVQFRKIAERAGVAGRVVTREGRGCSTSRKTFHALRHSFISPLANRGVACEVRQKPAGHSHSKVHANCTQHELLTLRGAISKLPSFKGVMSISTRHSLEIFAHIGSTHQGRPR